jgi:phosphatidylserine decarboxylase
MSFIHREGRATIIIAVLVLYALYITAEYFLSGFPTLFTIIDVALCALLLIVVQFFRNPRRKTVRDERHVIAPADGKVVVIEEAEEPEFFKGKRLQISIFMSPFNVHVNRYPVSGKVVYSKYHPGLYLVAWHPKSSTDNERTTVVVETKASQQVLFRQIAGALARRIVCYAKEGQAAVQGEEFGFIKFGSRVDIFLPVGTQVNVSLNQKVCGGETVIASF